MALERHRTRSSTASMQGLAEPTDTWRRFSLLSQEGSETGRVQRRLSDLHASFRARTMSLRSQTSDANDPNYDCAESIISLPHSVPDQEQFIDGRVTPTVNRQRPGFVRTFSRSNRTSPHYEAETTPNMAYIHQEANGVAWRRSSPSPNLEDLADSEADDYRLEQLGRRRGVSFSEPTTTTFSQGRSIAEMIHSESESWRQRRSQHSRRPALETRLPRHLEPAAFFNEGPHSGRSELIREGEEDLNRHSSMRAQLGEVESIEGEDIDYFGSVMRRSMQVKNTRVPVNLDELSPAFLPRGPLRVRTPDLERDQNMENSLKPNPLRIDKTDKQEYDAGKTHRTTSMNEGEYDDYFGSTIPSSTDDHGLSSHARLRQPHPPSPAQSARDRSRSNSPTKPRPLSDAPPVLIPESNIHPAYRRQPITPVPTTYPKPSPRRFNIFKWQTPSHLPQTELGTHAQQQPNRRRIALWRWVQDQPREHPLNEVGATFTTNLQNDIAPAHWLLHWLQSGIWVGFVIWLLIIVKNLDAETKIPFECYELKTQLRLQASNTTTNSTFPTQKACLNSTSKSATSSAPKTPWVPSEVTLPPAYILHNSSSTCLLTPLNHAVLLSNNFITLFVTGVCCCGLAFLTQAVLYKMLGPLMRRSGAYGAGTLMIRVVGQGVSAAVGAVVVCGVVWGIMKQ